MTMLHAALVTPLSGPLALFGRSSAHGLSLWSRYAARLPSPWTGVTLEVLDSAVNLIAALQTAINTQPDVLFGPYGSSPMLAAARISERVIWNHGGASAQLTRQAFPRVINVISPATTYFTGILQAVRMVDPYATSVTIFHTSTGFGRDIASGASKIASELGFKIQAISFDPGHATELVANVPTADILLVAGNFDDERAISSTLLTRSWRAVAFVGAGVEEVLASHVREGMLGPAQWINTITYTPDEGPDAGWFNKTYRQEIGVAPPYPAAQAFAAGLIYARCLRASGSTADDAQLSTAYGLDCTTLYGKFRLDPGSGLQIGHLVLLVQWQQGVRRVVWPLEYAERPLRYPFNQLEE